MFISLGNVMTKWDTDAGTAKAAASRKRNNVIRKLVVSSPSASAHLQIIEFG